MRAPPIISDDEWNAFRIITRKEADAELNIFRDANAKPKRDAPPLERKAQSFRRKPVIAYDLETTNIAEGTPRVLYITAFAGKTKGRIPFQFSAAVAPSRLQKQKSDAVTLHLLRLLEILELSFLVSENHRCRFVAWNGNGYDAFFIAEAIKRSPNWIIHPYLTKGRTLRGMKVEGIGEKQGLEFEFLDGMAMTGLDSAKMPLKKFLKLFAPEYQKKDLDFEHESFDANNPRHVEYAERDAEGLWYGMRRANGIMRDLTGNDLQPTMGKAGIAYFQSQIPHGVKIWKAPDAIHATIHKIVKRGGYVWIARQFKGRVWKYDINQAYAAAMRDCRLPCGSGLRVMEYEPSLVGVYHCNISRKTKTPIPFYFKHMDGSAGFTTGRKAKTWICSNEIEHLQNDDWKIEILEGYCWQSSFNMRAMVNKLEKLRFSDPDGPSGALGTMVKMIGNGAFGKTLELLNGVSLVMALECPDGYQNYFSDKVSCIYAKLEEAQERPYHKPQLGAFITAHNRIVLREACLPVADAFIYADTDCIALDRPAHHLTIDAKHYGDWKAETEGVPYIFIGKKVYWGADGSTHAKGLRTKELNSADFQKWLLGKPPTQTQIQRNNLIKVLTGEPMFRTQTRRGTDVRKSKVVRFDGEKFAPAD